MALVVHATPDRPEKATKKAPPGFVVLPAITTRVLPPKTKFVGGLDLFPFCYNDYPHHI